LQPTRTFVAPFAYTAISVSFQHWTVFGVACNALLVTVVTASFIPLDAPRRDESNGSKESKLPLVTCYLFIYLFIIWFIHTLSLSP